MQISYVNSKKIIQKNANFVCKSEENNLKNANFICKFEENVKTSPLLQRLSPPPAPSPEASSEEDPYQPGQAEVDPVFFWGKIYPRNCGDFFLITKNTPLVVIGILNSPGRVGYTSGAIGLPSTPSWSKIASPSMK